MEKIHAEERKLWEAERDSHREKIAQAVSEAMQEQRKQNQVSTFLPFHAPALCIFGFTFECLLLLWQIFLCHLSLSWYLQCTASCLSSPRLCVWREADTHRTKCL